MKTIGERIKASRENKSWSQKDLALAARVSQVTITHLEAGRNKSSKFLVQLATALDVSPRWLATGDGDQALEPVPSESKSLDPPQEGSNVFPSIPQNWTMPLISWVAAGIWCESPDNFQPGDADEWLPRPPGAGPRSFALTIQGDSMTSPFPGERSYPAGTVIYVDPDKAVINGSRIVARVGTEYTFKVYVEDMGRSFLKPINPQYPMIEMTEDTHICGVVFGSFRHE